MEKLLYSVCCEEIGIAMVGINYFSALSNISTGIIQWNIPKQGYVTRNYPTPQVVVYYHPLQQNFRNLLHGSYVEQMCTKCCYSIPAVTFIKAPQYTMGKHLLLLFYLQ